MYVVKTLFSLFALSLFIFTHAHAEKDLNSILSGTYAINTNWGCTHFLSGFSAVINTQQFTTAGEITYFGDGTASESGRVAITFHSDGGGGPFFGDFDLGFGDIGTYECNWNYEVNDDEILNCNSGPSPTVVECDLKYSGRCTAVTVGAPAPGVDVIDQVWYGKIGRKGDGILGNGKTPNIILIERHDANPERESEAPDSPFSICGKTGTQVKIRGALPQE